MTKYFKFSYTAIVLIILLLSGSVFASGFKTTELNRKMVEMSSLQQGLSDKIALAMAKRNQLEQKTEALQEEIRQQKDQLQIRLRFPALLLVLVPATIWLRATPG